MGCGEGVWGVVRECGCDEGVLGVVRECRV